MTFDIYNNRIPLGLLTDEEKAALQAHRGSFEFCNVTTLYQWRLITDPSSWFPGTSYRAVPEPLRHAEPPWHVMSDDIQYVAQDEDGAIFLLTPAKSLYPFIIFNSETTSSCCAKILFCKLAITVSIVKICRRTQI